MTNKKQVQSYNTKKYPLLNNDLDNLTNNFLYLISKISLKYLLEKQKKDLIYYLEKKKQKEITFFKIIKPYINTLR